MHWQALQDGQTHREYVRKSLQAAAGVRAAATDADADVALVAFGEQHQQRRTKDAAACRGRLRSRGSGAWVAAISEQVDDDERDAESVETARSQDTALSLKATV